MYSQNHEFPRRHLDASVPGARAGGSLTYEPFFGLREKAFSLSADPRFLYRSPAHGPAFDDLLTGIRRREGLIVLTGEIGTGKTTLCRSVLQHLDRRTFAAFVADPFVSREDLLKTLLVDFGVISISDLTRGRFDGASRSDLSYPLYEFLDSLVPLQAFAVVVIDEAQNLSLPLLEEIRILSELERREKLLQVVLVGQPELRSNLRLPQMRQVDQRVSVCCELTPLDINGVAGYVNHRLRVAALRESRVEFTGSALGAIYEGSSGIPRLINRICDRALQHAHAAQSMRIDSGFVWEALDDLGLSSATRPQDQATLGERSSDASNRPSIAEASAPVATPAASAVISVPPAADSAVEPELAAAVGNSVSQPASVGRSVGRGKWVAAGAVSFLAVAASLGAPGEPVDVTSLLPSPPAGVFALPPIVVPHLDAASPESLAADAAVPASTAAPAAKGAYSIVVASFESRDRAERLVQELTDAGYRARAVERDAGARGRLVQVTVGGYTSAIEVQRDLQHIRELPGGYGDARIVERD